MARDPIEILISQSETRAPALVPIRHGRRMRSPFACFRGAAAVVAADLAATEVSGVRAQLCDDAIWPTSASSPRPTAGRRVVEGQQLMQAASDVSLGWIRVEEDIDGHRRDYYIRQLWDARASARVETMSSDELADYAAVCGWTLARAHARSGDPAAIGRGDGFDREMGRFAKAHAAQNEEDHAALVAAVESGRVPAQPGL